MTGEQAVTVALKYHTLLTQLGFQSTRRSGDSKLRSADQPLAIDHAYWMCGQIETLVAEGRIEKAMRWLGFVQGVLWTAGIMTIDEMKDDNR